VFFAAGFSGPGLLFPSYFQQLLHQTPLQSGVHLIPQGVAPMLTIPIAGGAWIDAVHDESCSSASR